MESTDGGARAGADLLARARDGDRQALDAVFERAAGKLLALIRLRLGRDLRRRVESRDVLQATMLKAFERLAELRSRETASFLGWLARIAENEIRDQAAFHGRERRDARREVALEGRPRLAEDLVADLRSASSRLVWSEQAARLERALEALAPEHREVVLLRRYEELSYPEIGRRLGRSPDACRMLFARAMTALTAALDGD